MAKEKEELNLDTDTAKTAPAGLKWLFEMEAINSPSLLNNLYGNIYSFPNVADAEILIDRHGRKMLIYIQFTWIVRKVFKSRKKDTIVSLLDNLQELLPSFEFRVIENKALFDTAVARMQTSLYGGPNEKIPDPATNTAPGITVPADAGNSDGGTVSAKDTDASPETNRSESGTPDSDPNKSSVSGD